MDVKFGDINIWFARYLSGGVDFTLYFIIAILFIFISYVLQKKYNESLFWKVFLFSTIAWIIVELILQAGETRTWYEPPTLFWSIEINYPITAFLQGPMEGGVPTVLMYGCAKLFAKKKDKIFIPLTVLLFIVFVLVLFGGSGADSTISRRSLSLLSIIAVSAFTIIGLFIAFKYYEDVKYPLTSFIFMAVLGSLLNLLGNLMGIRLILVANNFTVGQEASDWIAGSLGIIIFGILWDGVIEISGIYFGFYMITALVFGKKDFKETFREV